MVGVVVNNITRYLNLEATLQIRVPESLKEKIAAAARENDRSLSAEARRVLLRAFNEPQPSPSAPTEVTAP